jgi:ribosomal protein S15P/S13E
MKIIVLEDMGQVEAAKILVGALIESGQITDPYELNFLTHKIEVLEEKLLKNRQDVEK